MTMTTSLGLTRTALAAGVAMLVALAVPAGAQNPPAGRAQPPGHSPALKSGAKVTVNFVNADIEAVTRAFAAMIERQIVVDPRVRGNVTVYSEQPITVREAYLNYLSALRGLGFAMVETGGLLKVVPEADAKLQTGTVSVGEVGTRGDQILTQIFNLKHENPNNLVPILRPLISANNTINVSPGTNALVITDYADNLQRLQRIIAALDAPAFTDFEVVPLKHAVAADIAPLAQRLADGSGGPIAAAVPGAAGGGGATTIVADSRSNSLIVRAPNAARLAVAMATIDKLDRPAQGTGPAGNLWVVHLKHAEATRLATVLRAAFGGSGGTGGGTTATAATAAITPTAAGGAPGTGAAAAQATAPITAAAQPSTGGFIQADPATNSLIITAPEPLYKQVRAMIDQLDTRRSQIYIESLIVEVSGENAADFGFQWQGIVGKRGDSNLVVGGTNFTPAGGAGNIISLSTGAATGQIALGEGINIGLIRNFGGTYALAAIARALQSQANTNIISTPNLITLDNEEAKIIVGSNVPFITGQFTNTGATGGATVNPFQTIERKDVGITLRVKPQIGADGTIRMTIFQESSSVSDKVAPGTSNAGPSTNKRQIETNVVIDDGGILALGGLIEDRFVENRSKVPLLGDIPFVGGLFRSENRTKNRTNLMVFLRPTVLRDNATGEKLSLDRYDMIRAQQKDSQPVPSALLPINESPVLPPMRSPSAPAAAPDPAAPTPGQPKAP
jgi:general secretion pathway protein D